VCGGRHSDIREKKFSRRQYVENTTRDRIREGEKLVLGELGYTGNGIANLQRGLYPLGGGQKGSRERGGADTAGVALDGKICAENIGGDMQLIGCVSSVWRKNHSGKGGAIYGLI